MYTGAAAANKNTGANYTSANYTVYIGGKIYLNFAVVPFLSMCDKPHLLL